MTLTQPRSSLSTGEPLVLGTHGKHDHTCSQASSHEVQKGRDWQCRGPTCPLPQSGHAPRASTWFFSSGSCATVRLSTIYTRLFFVHFLLLAFPFRSNFDERNYGNHDNPFLVNFLPIECPTKDKKLLRFITCFFADFLLLVCTSLEFKSRKEIIRINDPFLVNFFSPPKRQKLLRLFLLIIQPSDRNSGYFSGDLRDIRTKNSFFLDDWNLNKYRWQIINNSSRDNYSIINCVRVYIILNNFIAIDSTSQPVSSPILEPDRNEHRCILVPIAVFHDRS